MAPTRSSGRRTRNRRKTQPIAPRPPVVEQDDEDNAPDVEELFIDPMSGQPLQIYIEKDVDNRDAIADSVVKYGGVVSPGYSGVVYVLVDPHKESGQSLYRQYVGKKNKIILNASWIAKCIQDNTLHGFSTSWGGCKLTGKEQVYPPGTQPPAPDAGASAAAPVPESAPPDPAAPPPPFTTAPHPSVYQGPPMHPPPPGMHVPPIQPGNVQPAPVPAAVQQAGVAPSQTVHGHPMPVTASAHDALAQGHPQLPQQGPPPPPHPEYGYGPPMHPPGQVPPPPWQTGNVLVPQQTHMGPPPFRDAHDYRDWYPPHQPPPPPHGGPPPPHYPPPPPGHHPGPPPGPPVVEYPHPPPPHAEYDPRYREQHDPNWVDSAAEYYAQQYGPPAPYPYQPQPQPPQPPPSEPPQAPEAGPSTAPDADEAQTRGRKRSRTHVPGAPPASTLVANRKNPAARSPTPPTRVIKSTYGGNLFTVDDVMYLKKYIDYCQEQGMVLSLREICERIAIKAPHHTFYSWRRYCNKHQIRLGGYAMDIDTPDDTGEGPSDQAPLPLPSPPAPVEGQEGGEAPAEAAVEDEPAPLRPQPPVSGVIPDRIAAAKRAAQADIGRARSPTPPRALYRSTTGKGVAFTEEDVTFLIRFLEYRTRQQEGKLDMIAFWKDVAAKAPHHSRASWMKFYRRHRHELHHDEGNDAPLPAPPEKKMRYSKRDDVLLANYFAEKREGTLDRVFQDFARVHPHHPWKGWQEHHRIHKAKIDHLIAKVHAGESIDEEGEEE